MKINLKSISLILALFCFILAKAEAQSKPSTDTGGISFTPIQTPADSIAAAKKKADSVKKAQAKLSAPAKNEDAPKTLWQIFIAGFLFGFTALIMPCIFPMIPLTVSFFLKQGGNRQRGIINASVYGLSIISIYVALGMLVALIFGFSALNDLASNGVFNFFFFVLLVVFAASFLGAFEINLPSSLANKLDENSDKGGLSGIFFMAATLAVVSFSCTGPIIGFLLVGLSSRGELLAPAIGMFGFSLALAIPFTLFAIFPSLLKSLPKSGGWLNSVKVMLGFLELAFSVKFLSIVDLAYHWNWFNRDIFLSLWIVIGFLAGLYLLGKLKFSHDSDLAHISVPRLFLAIIIFSFSLYLIPGLWGAPLRFISAYLPPPATQEFNLNNGLSSAKAPVQTIDLGKIGPKKYEDLFSRGKIAGIEGWYDYDQALAVAKTENKPLLLDFTGWSCANCRTMENTVWSNPLVLKRLQQNFVIAELFVDEKTSLPEKEQFTSSFSGKKITTLGAKWIDFEASRFSANPQPYYVILNNKGNVLVPSQGAIFNVDEYIKFLDSGIAEYKKNNGSN